MAILIPLKPVVLVLGLLSGFVFASYFGSSVLEGKAPFSVAHFETRHTIAGEPARRADVGHKRPNKSFSARLQ
jgi:hypothetical protein